MMTFKQWLKHREQDPQPSKTPHPNVRQTGLPCILFEDAVIFLAGTLVTTAKNKRTNEARRLLKGLIFSGHIDSALDANADTWCWISV